MTWEGLEEACNAAEDRGLDEIQIDVPYHTRGNSVRLLGTHGPRSTEVACCTPSRTVAWWKISAVRRLITKYKAGRL